ncbi:hypothetical protein ACRCUN_33450 [Mycobacterium sp. LTG2003]
MSNTPGVLDILGLNGQGQPRSNLPSPVWPGDPGLAVTVEAHAYFTAAFDKYRGALQEMRRAMELISDGALPSVLTYTSAVETNNQLSNLAPEKVIATLDAYISYLDEYKNTVDAAIRRIQAEA